MNRASIDFALSHLNEDTARLLLSAARYPDIDMPAAVQQIEGMRAARDKWPSLLQCGDYLFPPRINREQSSSEATALHKARLLGPVGRVADLTGGMGIDSLFLARVATSVDYLELNADLCELMEHNCKALGVTNIAVHCTDSVEWLTASDARYDLVVVDPARRDAAGRKVVAFDDCQPNVPRHLDTILAHCHTLAVKASPMIDIDLGVGQLRTVAEVHVVAVEGECKEVLFLCHQSGGEPVIHCTNLRRDGSVASSYSFTREAEAEAPVVYCTEVGRYIYEPDASLLKGGSFRSVCGWFGVQKLDRNTHLYTSGACVESFPGRTFEVVGEVSLSAKAIRQAIPEGRANVICRGFPEAAAQLQRRLGLADGGTQTLLAATMGGRRVGFLCRQV